MDAVGRNGRIAQYAPNFAVLEAVSWHCVRVRDQTVFLHHQVLANCAEHCCGVVAIPKIAKFSLTLMELGYESVPEGYVQAAVPIEHQAEHRGSRAVGADDEKRWGRLGRSGFGLLFLIQRLTRQDYRDF